MVKLVDTLGSGSSWRKPVGVRVPLRAPQKKSLISGKYQKEVLICNCVRIPTDHEKGIGKDF